MKLKSCAIDWLGVRCGSRRMNFPTDNAPYRSYFFSPRPSARICEPAARTACDPFHGYNSCDFSCWIILRVFRVSSSQLCYSSATRRTVTLPILHPPGTRCRPPRTLRQAWRGFRPRRADELCGCILKQGLYLSFHHHTGLQLYPQRPLAPLSQRAEASLPRPPADMGILRSLRLAKSELLSIQIGNYIADNGKAVCNFH